MPEEPAVQIDKLLRIPGRIATLIGAGVVFGVLLIGVLALLHPRGTTAKSDFPAATIKQISGFKFYYLKPGFATDFKLQKDSIHYHDGVLVFAMKNSVGKTLAWTEQVTPVHFEPSMLTTDKQFNTEYGLAMITDAKDRTSGTLFSKDNTWIVINAPDPIGADTMQQLLGGLVPAK